MDHQVDAAQAAESSASAEPEQSGAATRRRILTVALELFAVKGYAGTSIRDITEQLGLTKASLYYHFTSKEEILKAVTAPLKADFEGLRQLTGQVPAPGAAEILAGVVDVLSRRVAMIRLLMGDPSTRLDKDRPPQEHLEHIAAALAPDDSPGALLRARCALGAAQFGAFVTASHVAAADPPFAGAPDRERTVRILAGDEHLLSDGQRAEIVDAALRALDGEPGSPD